MPLSTSVIPALSTIHVPKQNLGKTAAERLINVIESDEYYSVKIEISADVYCAEVGDLKLAEHTPLSQR